MLNYFRILLAFILLIPQMIFMNILSPIKTIMGINTEVIFNRYAPEERIVVSDKADIEFTKDPKIRFPGKTPDKLPPVTAPSKNQTSDKGTNHKGSIKITLSAAGDCTLGSDESFGSTGTFDWEFKKQGGNYSYFFSNVRDIFSKDDLTIVNLETPLTKARQKAEKKFRFKGDPSYVNILKEGSIEAVNIANNHSFDYLDKGYRDTVNTLNGANQAFFGWENKYIYEVKGIKVGLLGYTGWENNIKFKKQLREDIYDMKKKANLVVVSFHWGIERVNQPNTVQRDLGHYCIDLGADLVLGHHPHVIQGIESYKNRYIVYSLGNFSFGGNKNPSDKDTFIFQQSFEFDRTGKLLSLSDKTIIPCSISSVSGRNDFRPTPLKGRDRERVMKRMKAYSSIF